MSASLARSQVVALPKAHLHLHLEGSARPATIRELGEHAGASSPVLDGFASFPEFDRLYLAMLGVIGRPEDLNRICRELVEDEARAGVVYLEPSINPAYWAARFRISPGEALAVMSEAFADAGARHRVEIGLMIGCPRDFGVEVVEQMATFAAEHANAGVVSLGICGSEPQDAHRPYRRACAIAREAGLLIVPHAGEQRGAASVRDAVEQLAPDRIAHGFRAVEDPDVLAQLAGGGIVCDVCLTSNVATGAVASLAEHPLPRMREAGVRVTLGADDSLFFGADLADEYVTAQRLCDAEPLDLAHIARDSVRASGASAQTVVDMLAGIDTWANAFSPAPETERR
jgi:adenosine deaminase